MSRRQRTRGNLETRQDNVEITISETFTRKRKIKFHRAENGGEMSHQQGEGRRSGRGTTPPPPTYSKCTIINFININGGTISSISQPPKEDVAGFISTAALLSGSATSSDAGKESEKSDEKREVLASSSATRSLMSAPQLARVAPHMAPEEDQEGGTEPEEDDPPSSSSSFHSAMGELSISSAD